MNPEGHAEAQTTDFINPQISQHPRILDLYNENPIGVQAHVGVDENSRNLIGAEDENENSRNPIGAEGHAEAELGSSVCDFKKFFDVFCYDEEKFVKNMQEIIPPEVRQKIFCEHMDDQPIDRSVLKQSVQLLSFPTMNFQKKPEQTDQAFHCFVTEHLLIRVLPIRTLKVAGNYTTNEANKDIPLWITGALRLEVENIEVKVNASEMTLPTALWKSNSLCSILFCFKLIKGGVILHLNTPPYITIANLNALTLFGVFFPKILEFTEVIQKASALKCLSLRDCFFARMKRVKNEIVIRSWSLEKLWLTDLSVDTLSSTYPNISFMLSLETPNLLDLRISGSIVNEYVAYYQMPKLKVAELDIKPRGQSTRARKLTSGHKEKLWSIMQSITRVQILKLSTYAVKALCNANAPPVVRFSDMEKLMLQSGLDTEGALQICALLNISATLVC